MKYWLFANNQVAGPYDPDELSRESGFSAESLVCPEGRKGTSMGDWQRAGMVPELTASLMRVSQLAPAAKAQGAGGYAAFAPEPAYRDSAAMEILQGKVGALEGTVSQLEENLRLKDGELVGLRRELEEKHLEAQELALKIAGLEDRLTAVTSLRENVDKAVAAEREVESAVGRQGRTLEDLSKEIEALKAGLKERSAAPAPGMPPAPAEEKPAALPEEQAPAPEMPPSSSFPASLKLEPLATFGMEEPAAAPSAAPAAEAPAEPPSVFAGSEPSLLTPLSAPAEAAPAAEELPASVELLSPSQPAPAETAAQPEAAAPQPKWRSKPVLAGAAALGLAAIGALAYMTGLLPFGRPVLETEAPLGEPAGEAVPGLSPQAAAPLDPSEELKQSAVSLVKAWPGPDGSKPLGEILEAAAPASGELSPWLAERIKDDSFQVNYYAPASASAASRTYEFEVSLGLRRVVARNDAARELMSPKPAAPAARKRPVRVRAKAAAPAATPPEGAPILDELLKLDEPPAPESPKAPAQAAPPAAKAAPPPKAKRDVGKELDELITGGDKGRKSKAGKDQFILPGFPKGELDEPQGEKPPAKGKKSAESELLDDLLTP